MGGNETRWLRDLLFVGMRHGWPDPVYIFRNWTWLQLHEMHGALTEMVGGRRTGSSGRDVADASPEYLGSIARYTRG
jgi:hypothetical protein